MMDIRFRLQSNELLLWAIVVHCYSFVVSVPIPRTSCASKTSHNSGDKYCISIIRPTFPSQKASHGIRGNIYNVLVSNVHLEFSRTPAEEILSIPPQLVILFFALLHAVP